MWLLKRVITKNKKSNVSSQIRYITISGVKKNIAPYCKHTVHWSHKACASTTVGGAINKVWYNFTETKQEVNELS